jgi:hypothetical protein
MAFRDSKSCANDAWPSYYNLHAAVGPDCPNRKDDVMLVQFLLKQHYSSPQHRAYAPAGEMVVDGIWGPITSRWLVAFQLSKRNAGWLVLVDGRADPARGPKSSISHTAYIIRILSIQWWSDLAALKLNIDRYNHLEVEPDAPGELRVAVGPPGADWRAPDVNL